MLGTLQYLSLPAVLAQSESTNANMNLTSFVNLFIGTASGANGGSGGNAFPGALFLLYTSYIREGTHCDQQMMGFRCCCPACYGQGEHTISRQMGSDGLKYANT